MHHAALGPTGLGLMARVCRPRGRIEHVQTVYRTGQPPAGGPCRKGGSGHREPTKDTRGVCCPASKLLTDLGTANVVDASQHEALPIPQYGTATQRSTFKHPQTHCRAATQHVCCPGHHTLWQALHSIQTAEILSSHIKKSVPL